MQNVYLIYDIGKTNKKCLIFSEEGNVIEQYSEELSETTDEDGFACENINLLKEWVLGQYFLLKKNSYYKIKAINFASYGASWVNIDEKGIPVTPLYNYLKPLPDFIKEKFLIPYFNKSANEFALNTASPFMGMLNSGLQLYWLKHTKPEIWNKVHYCLHLPQYLSCLFTGKALSDYTSVGCHTGLWNFKSHQYHSWVLAEEIDKKLAPLTSSAMAGEKDGIGIGTGLHDSSSALIPYLQQYKEPFLLISTGTWCISLNPFNKTSLTVEELKKDTLCYLQANGEPVKASRVFLGKEHEYQTKRIAAQFGVPENFYQRINAVQADTIDNFIPACMEGSGPQPEKQTTAWDLSAVNSPDLAYNVLMKGLVRLLKESIDLVVTENTKKFFIDGGFASNPLFRYYLQQYYPGKTITPVEFQQASALGALLYVRDSNT